MSDAKLLLAALTGMLAGMADGMAVRRYADVPIARTKKDAATRRRRAKNKAARKARRGK